MLGAVVCPSPPARPRSALQSRLPTALGFLLLFSSGNGTRGAPVLPGAPKPPRAPAPPRQSQGAASCRGACAELGWELPAPRSPKRLSQQSCVSPGCGEGGWHRGGGGRDRGSLRGHPAEWAGGEAETCLISCRWRAPRSWRAGS